MDDSFTHKKDDSIFITNKFLFICIILLSYYSYSCTTSYKEDISIKLVKDNRNTANSYCFDYDNAFQNGFIIPSKSKDKISDFKFIFKIKNTKKEDTLYYKLYYQNESYKFLENGTNNYPSENFYGCSLSTLTSFNILTKINNAFNLTDSLIIAGNPRDEDRYYGRNEHSLQMDTLGLSTKIASIRGNKEWFLSIVEKAKNNGISAENQLKLDALYMLKQDDKSKNNNKWQRNPRVGVYSVLLVIATKEGLNKLPDYIINTTKKSEKGFINPYNYFLDNKYLNKQFYTTLLIKSFITVKAKVPLLSGIYIPYSNIIYKDKSYFNKYVNDSRKLYNKAGFEIQSTSLHQKEIFNLPIKANFLSGNYTKKEYEENTKKYNNQRIPTRFLNTIYPGKTIGIDTTNATLWFKNPACEDKLKKENVGVRTRHGLAYGKYTFKIKMANLLTKDNVWTGLTNAMWLVTESDKAWNNRRICTKAGYMPFYGAGKGEKRVPQMGYSEIDFEILKTAQTWPKTSYLDKKDRKEPISNDDKVMVTCTNWDMACKEPKNFGIGIQKVNYNNQAFYPHRWDEYYNALTSKTPEKDVDLFGGDFYYYQIEWKPTEIIWRIGPDKKHLKVVGYLNDKISAIPNNQMVAVITQEYHFSEWWPKSPYKQEDIPFLGEDLKGTLYSLEIE